LSERDLLAWAVMVVAAEENARLIAERLAEKVEVSVTPAPATSSIVVRKANVSIPCTLIEEYGRGCLKELVIRSANKNYLLRVYADGLELYSNGFTWFQEISPTVEEIDAFEDNGTYVLRLSDIHFAKSLKVVAEPAITILSASKLDEVFCKIDLAKTF